MISYKQIFAVYVTGKRPFSFIFKELLKFNKKKIENEQFTK